MKTANSPAPKEIKSLSLDRQICSLRYSPCGRFLMAGGFDSSIRRWDVSKDPVADLPILKGHHGWVERIAFGPEKPFLYSADTWGQLRAWDYTIEEPKTLWQQDQAHNGWIRGVAVSPNGKLLATCGADRKVCLWTREGKKVREWQDGEDVFSVAFHPDGQSLVSGNLKGNIRQYEVASGKHQRDLNASVLYLLHRLQDVGGARCLQFDAKGAVLACAGITPKNGANVQGKPTILLFDWKSGKVKETIQIGATSDGFVYDLELHPNGYLIGVTSGNPGTGKFFCHTPGEEKPFFLWTKIANCHCVSLHPNGKLVAVSGTNRGSNGNGRRLNKDKEYQGNHSPIHFWTLG